MLSTLAQEVCGPCLPAAPEPCFSCGLRLGRDRTHGSLEAADVPPGNVPLGRARRWQPRHLFFPLWFTTWPCCLLLLLGAFVFVGEAGGGLPPWLGSTERDAGHRPPAQPSCDCEDTVDSEQRSRTPAAKRLWLAWPQLAQAREDGDRSAAGGPRMLGALRFRASGQARSPGSLECGIAE